MPVCPGATMRGMSLRTLALCVMLGPLVAQDPPLRTAFAPQGRVPLPRPEHPRPLLVREKWTSLNGQWSFARGERGGLAETILVPFAPECALSGLFAQQELIERCRYRRTFTVPRAWKGLRVLLHFEAVDWEAKVRVDGNAVGEHRGGYDAFAFDVTDALGAAEEHVLEVDVFDPADPAKGGFQPRGKQLGSHGIWYTRTTGIWRSVWLEAVSIPSIERMRVRTSHAGELEIAPEIRARGHLLPGHELLVRISGSGKDGRPVRHEISFAAEGEPTKARVADVRAWTPEDPALYDLEVTLRDREGRELDKVTSYCGFRSVDVTGGVFRLNGVPRFFRGVLDQGYWPESGLTAPSDAALEFDVRALKELGLDLARKHVKVEDARWYHWCDKLGVMVMQDMPSSMNLASQEARSNFVHELTAMVTGLASQPCIVHWVVFNEDWGHPEAFQDECVELVRKLDPTRVVTDASGWTQRKNTDVTDVHDYGPNLARHALPKPPARAKVVGECGGVAFSLDGHRWTSGWGYTSARTKDSFLRRIGRLVAQVSQAKYVSGFVWTQLTDVEQELNGLLHYDRTDKVERTALRTMLLGKFEEPARASPVVWQVCGPFATGAGIEHASGAKENTNRLRAALVNELVTGEGKLDGATPLEVAGHRFEWSPRKPQDFAIDLATPGGKNDNAVCYAVGRVSLDKPQRLRLSFGSDDAARVWIDGKQVHEVVAVRGVALGSDEIEDLELAAGEHTVVVKVVNGVHGFGFALCFERS